MNGLTRFAGIMQNLLPDTAASLCREPVLKVEVAKNATARVLQVADEVNANLIVMDVQPEHALATHLRDKVYPIISWANCPVLTVRAQIKQGTSHQSAAHAARCVTFEGVPSWVLSLFAPARLSLLSSG